jgi:hypothetical protein
VTDREVAAMAKRYFDESAIQIALMLDEGVGATTGGRRCIRHTELLCGPSRRVFPRGWIRALQRANYARAEDGEVVMLNAPRAQAWPSPAFARCSRMKSVAPTGRPNK